MVSSLWPYALWLCNRLPVYNPSDSELSPSRKWVYSGPSIECSERLCELNRNGERLPTGKKSVLVTVSVCQGKGATLKIGTCEGRSESAGCHVFILSLSSPRCGSVLEHGSSRASPNRSSHSLCPSRRPSPSSLSASLRPLSSSPRSPSTLPGLQHEVRQKSLFSAPRTDLG